MPDIRIVVTRESVSDQWPAERVSQEQTYVLPVIQAAQNGEHNCEMSFLLGEDGLSKEVIFTFPTTEDRDAWWAAKHNPENDALLFAVNDDPDSNCTYWAGFAEDYPG